MMYDDIWGSSAPIYWLKALSLPILPWAKPFIHDLELPSGLLQHLDVWELIYEEAVVEEENRRKKENWKIKIMKDDSNLWNKVYEADLTYVQVSADFFNGCTQKKMVIKEALASPLDRSTALRFLLLYLNTSERMEFFEQLVAIASFAHGNIALCRDVIHTLPREFVLANIEKVSEPLLQKADPAYQYEEYRRLLELYIEIDTNLTRRLALRASQSDIEDIREAGEDFLALLDTNE